ncbi:tRNA lysidine(34) synthetase TilS [Solimonas terrae]|uniref:tRNA(Ile)-lysidine synthase n=1 Tax=Solimonas terrae TaxID=1396819 RepID=A0A6M2BLN6_9GAMM|nr:tRNA lysidine(34) synthetase TilS [Solimonas terrae]NGY03546.1 tRNA lysidine(34) synthetase TilS [Solimonas terrae]
MKIVLPPLAPRARVWVALSGGLDSTALLHLLHESGVPNLRAVHVHHGLQAAADGWARQVRGQCRALDVPLSVRRVRVDPRHGGGPEAAAREARYAAFAAMLKAGDLLATAHHRDDQAETVLLRALRGTGIAGLAAMPVLAAFGAGRLWRPLLDQPRAELHRFAERRGLQWIDDPHNQDARYARSYLRTELMPRLGAHWPQAAASLARLAQRAADAEALVAALASQDLLALRVGDGWSVAGLLALDRVRRRNALYHAWVAMGWPAPAEARLARLDEEILRARGDAQPLLRHESGEVRRFRDVLHFLPHLPPVPDQVLAWPARRRALTLPAGLGELRLSRPSPLPLQVGFARGGERLKPAAGRHSRSLKQLCQEAGIPPWVRVRMPLLLAGDELLAIAGYWRSAKAVELGLDPEWQTTLAGAGSTGFSGKTG